MTYNEDKRNFDRDDAPDALVEALKTRFGVTPAVSEAVDRAVITAVRGRMAARRRIRVLRWASIAAAAAASLILAVTLAKSPAGKSWPQTAAAEDCNGDGVVDILDAFVLARSVEASSAPAARFDFTGDGLVDRRDVDAVAMVAVSLDRGKVL